MNVLEIIGLVSSALILVVVLVAVFVVSYLYVDDKRSSIKSTDHYHTVKTELLEIARWCGHDFPILDDLVERLFNVEEFQPDIMRWREDMRKKHLTSEGPK